CLGFFRKGDTEGHRGGTEAHRGMGRFLNRVNLALLFPALATLIVYVSLLRYIQTINWSGYQGRLAFTAAAPIAVLLAVGLARLGGARLAQGIGAALLGLSVGTA